MPSPNATRQIIRNEVPELYPPAAYADRIVHIDRFSKRPILAADLDPATVNQTAQRLLTGANLDWIISGTNAANAGSALNTEGGILLTTAGADNDQIVLSPATAINSIGQSPFGVTQWQPDHAARFEATIELPAITNITAQVGFALTTALDLTTDDDYIKFQFSTEGATSTANWTVATGVGGTDVELDAGIAPVAARSIRLAIEIPASGRIRAYINGLEVLKNTLAIPTAAANLIPIAGIQALEVADKSIAVREVICSRLKTAA